MGELVLHNLSIDYGSQRVIRNLHLQVADGELVSILGPSGAGKTSILKAVAGLIEPSGGEIRLDGRSLSGVAPEQRNIVMVFQQPLLFPFMNVEQNVGFGLRMQRMAAAEAKNRIDRILELTRLTGLGTRKIHELSGGQQQRVTLARALVLNPALLLLDEPLSNLDANLRQQMRELIRDIQEKTRISMLFVTHDQAEALIMSHRAALLLDGQLRQMGSPRELFHAPADPDVARFFGAVNFFEGRMQDGLFQTDFGTFELPVPVANGHPLTATIRPEDVLIAAGSEYQLRGTVKRARFEGTVTRVWVECSGGNLVVLSSNGDFEPGRVVTLYLPPEKIRVFPPTDRRS